MKHGNIHQEIVLLWSSPDYDDAAWDTLNPKLEWEQYDTSKWTGIGWFRKNIIIDSSLYLTNLYHFTIDHFGASEIYLMVRKFISYGKGRSIPR